MNNCFCRWWTGPWQVCPATCGNSSEVFRKRTVLCIEQTDQEPIVFTQPPGLRHHGGIEYLGKGRKIHKSLKEYLEEELNNDEQTLKEYLEEEIVALPDVQCKGQEKPSEDEPCPNLPPCTPSPNSEPKSNGTGTFENGFSESDINCSDSSSSQNVNCEWLKTLEKKGKKIRHELRKNNETMKIFYNLNKDKKSFNRKNKKVKKRKREKLKKVLKSGDVEKSQNEFKFDQVYLKKSNVRNGGGNFHLLKAAKSNAMNYIYYKSDKRKHRN